MSYEELTFVLASFRGDIETVRKLLQSGVHVDATDENIQSLLMMACRYGHAEVVRMLLSAGAHVNDQHEYGWSSLMIACRAGHAEVVKMLLSAGAHTCINDKNKNGESSLMMACWYGHAEVVRMLLSAGAHIKKYGKSELMRACENGHAEVVRMLLSAGAHINDQYENGESSLMMACWHGHAEIVKMLLSAGAHTCINDKNKYGDSSLMMACRYGHAEVVKMLLSAGAHINDQNMDGWSSLMMACRNGRAEVVKMLLSAGAHVNHQNKNGSTALHWAAVEGDGGCVRLLLSTPGIDANLVDHKGNTPLKLSGGYEVLTMLQKYTTSCEDFPVHTYGKVIMCGDSGAGKSTLTEAIKDCSQSMSEDGEGDQQPARKPIRKPVKALTAGIISHRVKGPKANMTIYDLAGHREYYSSHSSILEHISNTTPSIFLLLVNLLLTLKEITAQLYFWSAMIGNVCKKCSQQSSIIVVGTHADCISDEGKLEFLRTQIEQVARDAIKQHIFVQFTALNVTSFRGEVFGSFLSLLYGTIDEVRLRCPAISLTCHVMYAFLNDKVPADQDALSLSQLLNLLSQEDPKVLPTDATEVSEHLKVLSAKGFIVFFASDTKLNDSWIVFRPEALLEKVNGVLFAPSNFEEHLPIASNTGLIPISVLKCHFPEPKYNIDMMTQFLVRFELCQPITFASTSTNAQGALNCTSCPDLFFPPLVCANRPDNVIIPDDALIWQICSTNINQSFSPRFLHVLVSRVADQFPLPTVGPCLVPELKPYNRRCTVWSRGISWRSKEGFSTVIEMREDFQCLLCAVSTSDKSNIHYPQLILSVIKVIKNARDEFCPTVSRVELITCPREATSDHVAAPVECEALKEMLVNGMTTMTDWNGNLEVNISQWSKMEPQLSHLIGVDHKQDAITATLNECDHGNIFQSTKSARDKWRAIGWELGFTSDELDSIVREPGRNGDEDYYEAMLKRWLDWAPPNHTPPSLQSLLSVLRAVGKERQANDLATKYKVTVSTHDTPPTSTSRRPACCCL